jgi:hypothetical protein
VAVSSALTAKWSHKDKLIPIQAKDLLPRTPEEQEKYDAAVAKFEAVQRKFLASQMDALVRSLKKKPDVKE